MENSCGGYTAAHHRHLRGIGSTIDDFMAVVYLMHKDNWDSRLTANKELVPYIREGSA